MADQITSFEAACWWLDQRFALLPCQPNSKNLVQGFGIHQKKIDSQIIAAHWWEEGRRVNLAVVAPAGAFILDFDEAALYRSWASVDAKAAETYTERTPRGGYHVFLFGDVPRGVRLKAGAELKQNCVVAPSSLNEQKYLRGVGAILHVDAVQTLSSLSEPGARTPHLLRTLEIEGAARARCAPARAAPAETLVERIKARFSPISVMQLSAPGFEVIGRGRFVAARCPFHKGGREVKPSMWIDTERHLWGCHACHIQGDSINLFARLRGISDREAIAKMAELLT